MSCVGDSEIELNHSVRVLSVRASAQRIGSKCVVIVHHTHLRIPISQGSPQVKLIGWVEFVIMYKRNKDIKNMGDTRYAEREYTPYKYVQCTSALKIHT